MKYIKVTDGTAVGYHSVDDDFKLPRPATEVEEYEWADAAEALEAVPGLAQDEPAKPATEK